MGSTGIKGRSTTIPRLSIKGFCLIISLTPVA